SRSATRASPSGRVCSCSRSSASAATARLTRTRSADSTRPPREGSVRLDGAARVEPGRTLARVPRAVNKPGAPKPGARTARTIRAHRLGPPTPGAAARPLAGAPAAGSGSAGPEGPAGLLGGVALREVADELGPGLSRVRVAALRAVGEPEPQQRLGGLPRARRELERLLELRRRPLEVARVEVRVRDPELGDRGQGIRRVGLDQLLELEDRLAELALVPAFHPAIEQGLGRAPGP